MATSRLVWMFWFTMILLSLPYFAWEFYFKKITPPVLTKVKENSTSPSKYPFPALSICNVNKVQASFYTTLTKKDELSNFFIRDICHDVNQTNMVPEEIRNKASEWKHYLHFQRMAAQTCADMIVSCKWGSVRNCSKWFQPILTKNGLCCGFNIAHQLIDSGKGKANEDWPIESYNNWTPEKKFGKNQSPLKIPRRLDTHVTDGLRLQLNVHYYEYACSENDSVGFEISMHSPLDMPQFVRGNYSFHVNRAEDTDVIVTPLIFEPDRSLQKLNLDDRRCYYLSERKLRFFRIFSYANCVLECQANYTIEVCGCLPKHIPVDFDIKICGKTEEECVLNMPQKYKDSCKCYPSCFGVVYACEVFAEEFPEDVCAGDKRNLANLKISYGSHSSDKYVQSANEKFLRWSYYASMSWRCFVAMMVILMIKCIHYYRHRPDICPSLLS